MKVVFGDIVVVENDYIGVVVKNWGASLTGDKPAHAEVYVRSYNSIKEYPITEIERYQVRHKELNEDEIEYQQNAELES